MSESPQLSRRGLLAASAPGLFAGSSLLAQGSNPISLPPFKADTERQSSPPPAPLPPDQRVGIAIVGLGRLTAEEIIPAFQKSQKARIAALVTGTPAKGNTIAQQLGLAEKNIYSYGNFDAIRENTDVQAVYVVLPNSLHREYVVRAAKAGKHVLCEKPMATSPAECEEMIAACRDAKRHLMVAYRIQYEPLNRMMREHVQQQAFGQVKLVESVNVQRQGEPNQWRHKKALAGGGALPDIGLYCLNTTRYLLGEEPVEVFAMTYSTPSDPRFREVEESITWQMRFPGGIYSTNTSSYDAHESRRHRVYATTGWFGLDPAFAYHGLRAKTAKAAGKVEHVDEPLVDEKNQFTLEIDHFADCVLKDKQPFTPGEEGLQDHRIMAAIYESAKSNRPVSLPPVSKRDAFRGSPPEAS